MKNPLIKRLPRELKNDFGKYFVIFIFISATIALISGFLVADNSIAKAYNESFTKYNTEDGNFELATPLTLELQNKLEANKLKVYDNNYLEETALTNDATIRIFKNRETVNKVCIMEGTLPTQNNEIALDRMFCDNNNLNIGDKITIANKEYKITALVALPDYSALFSNNSDMMFDALKFSIAIVNEDCFNGFGDSHLHYNYSFKYNQAITGDSKKADKSDEVMKSLSQNALVTNYTPEYLNQAIHFTGDDIGSDKAMFTMLLYIIIVIIAFVFAVITSNTITKEASVIGTLRASGYSKRELVVHYLSLPMAVLLLGAIVGNILGYTLLKDFFANMYYGSYSLPTYTTLINPDAFVLTTIIPLIIMFIINFVILSYKLNISPLKFMRHDLSRKQKEKAVKLSSKIKIFQRFRMRIILQNIPNYLIITIGIIFANLLLIFGLMFPPVLADYQKDITTNMISTYQYILKVPQITTNKEAEKFALTSKEANDEELSVYGIEANSRYVDLDFSNHQVYLSAGYSEKYGVKVGDKIKLTDKYSKDTYEFKISGIYDYPAAFGLFMKLDDYNKVFNYNMGNFNGYFSNNEIVDIDEKYLAATIDVDDLTKVSRQLSTSMGSAMYLIDGFAVVMFILLIYLLSKQVIEKNAQSISMTKILGYTNKEVNQLYIATNTIIVILAIFISLPIVTGLIRIIYIAMMKEMTGWLPINISLLTYGEMVALGLISYLLVVVLQTQKIKKVPMSDALKNIE